MTTQPHDLTPVQLDWCRRAMPAFAKANADVLRRDAEVAANRARFERPAARGSRGAAWADWCGTQQAR